MREKMDYRRDGVLLYPLVWVCTEKRVNRFNTKSDNVSNIGGKANHKKDELILLEKNIYIQSRSLCLFHSRWSNIQGNRHFCKTVEVPKKTKGPQFFALLSVSLLWKNGFRPRKYVTASHCGQKWCFPCFTWFWPCPSSWARLQTRAQTWSLVKFSTLFDFLLISLPIHFLSWIGLIFVFGTFFYYVWIAGCFQILHFLSLSYLCSLA